MILNLKRKGLERNKSFEMQLWCMGIKHFFPHVWFLSFPFECYHVLHMIRSMLGPISTGKATNSAKSKKSFNTRQTRSSRRTAPKNLLEENTNGNSVNEELLHMIDTLPFQPLLKAGQKVYLFICTLVL